MSCQNLNLEIKGELPLPHGINADDGIFAMSEVGIKYMYLQGAEDRERMLR